jgi:translation initiation factor 2B subunit (eIF-2B alpha/beta/delta family)
MSRVGAHLVALAAKRFSVPFVVLAGLHKLSPLFPHDPSLTFNDIKVRMPPTHEHCSFPTRCSFAVCMVLEVLFTDPLQLSVLVASL